MASLGALTTHVDPTLESDEGLAIKLAAEELAVLDVITVEGLAAWISQRPGAVPVLGTVVGLSLEKLKNVLQHGLGTAGFVTLARNRSEELITYMDHEFGLVALLEAQRGRDYDFGDILVARAGTRGYAVRAGEAGRKLEDEIEDIARGLGLPHVLRGRFVGRDGRDAPFDLAVPAGGTEAQIVVAAKSFGSTGSKLSDAVREIQDMASVRKPVQYVFAVIDGIGWKRRSSDLRKIYDLWAAGSIDGMYTSASLGQFQDDLADAAQRLKIERAAES